MKNVSVDTIARVFPYHDKDGTIYYLFKDTEVLKKDNTTKYMIHILDSNGYKYYLNFRNFEDNIIRKIYKGLNKFFKRNIYTYDNIRNFIKLNNVRLELLEEREVCGFAREKLKFLDLENNCVIECSWNDIQSDTERYKYGYSVLKEQRKQSKTISKEEAVKIIYEMQKNKNSPLDSSDFDPKQDGCIGIRTIEKYWGELWIMQKELGLEITGKHKRKISHEQSIEELLSLCNDIKEKENRTLITYDDIKNSKDTSYADIRPYRESCRELTGKNLREFLSDNGFELQKVGCGMNYVFSDGERIESQYEYLFSNVLRESGFIYNQNYFRTIRYEEIDNDYIGNMNCDYKIVFDDGFILYVELAGILGNPMHITCYNENKPINSKSKEEYRLKLIQKREMLERNNLNYLILLKPDMTEENFRKILNKYICRAT